MSTPETPAVLAEIGNRLEALAGKAQRRADGTYSIVDARAHREYANQFRALAAELRALAPATEDPAPRVWNKGDKAVWRGRLVEIVTSPPFLGIRLDCDGFITNAYRDELSEVPTPGGNP